MRSSARAAALLLLLAAPAAAQDSEVVRAGAIYERYRFDDGYVVDGMSQLTIPVSLEVALGKRAGLVLSTGYVAVDLDSADPVQIADQHLEGPLDTQLRLDVDVVPDRLVAFVATTVPTGRKSLVGEQLSLLVALSNDAIGFSAPSLGTGGSVTAGFSTAMSVRGFALGLAATGAYAFPYEPVLPASATLTPGAEVRIRVGVEGPLAARTYVRVAASGAARQKDQLGGAPTHGLGRRAIGYVTLEQGVGPALVGLYAFDVFRGSPQLEPTAIGAAILPRGNLLAGGVTITLPLGTATTVVPSAEYRTASAAETVDGTHLVRQASSFRAGAELRRRLVERLSLVGRGEGAFGEVRQGVEFFGFKGFRAALSLEVSP